MNATKQSIRTCEIHISKPAKWPKNDPHFCTMRCAAIDNHMNTTQRWCDKHGWYHKDDGCYECERASE